MDAALKELEKLEKLVGNAPNKKAKSKSISDALDHVEQLLERAQQQSHAGALSPRDLQTLAQSVEAQKKSVDERQKEIYSAMSRVGKALDKRFPNDLPSYPDLFASDTSITALERTLALHFLRTGQFETAQTFLEESKVEISAELRSQFIVLHGILKALRNQDIGPALSWSRKNHAFLQSRSSPLEFYLHRSQYMHLLLVTYPNNPRPAIAYANEMLRPFYAHHDTEFLRLMACLAYLPISRLRTSPYAELASHSLHTDLEPLFAKEYCASLGMSKQVPLRVVGDIGGGGALVKIEKGRKIMRERKSEWSQTDELPIEIPLAPEHRYHSIFTCPVSKEQSTDQNPPMMLACGHVISRDSLQKLPKPDSNKVKCPYCPTESNVSLAMQVYF